MARSSDGTAGWKLASADIGQGFTNVNGPWTIAFWIKMGSLIQTNTYVSLILDGGGGQTAILFGFVPATLEFFSNNYTGTDPRTGSQILFTDTNWHHIANRKAASGTAAYAFFVDGVKTTIDAAATTTLVANNTAPTVFTLFAAATAGGGSSNECNCALEQYGMYTAALTDGQIANMAAGTLDGATLTTGMLNYWPLCGTASPETDLGSANAPLTVTSVIQATGPSITSTCSGPVFMPRKTPRRGQAVNRASTY